jgi:hypothetical protein
MSPFWVAFLAGLAFVVERRRISLNARVDISVSFLPIVFSAVVGGPLDAAVVGAVAVLADFGWPHARWFLWTCSSIVSASSAGFAADAVGHGLENGSFGAILLKVVTASLIDVVASAVLAIAILAYRGGEVRALIRRAVLLTLGALFLYAPTAAILVHAYANVSHWSAALFFAPVIAAQQLLVLYRQQKEIAEELEQTTLSFVASLIVTLDARDSYTAGHSVAVALYSRDIAVELGLDDETQRKAYLAGLIHDIGKVGLPAGLLEKESALTAEEFDAVKEHPAIGERIIVPVRGLSALAPVVRHHHERIDGTGYPDGLMGDAIPLLARIVAVADTYSAMSSTRPYRAALSPAEARGQLRLMAGHHLDRADVAGFLTVLEREGDSYHRAAGDDFAIDFGGLVAGEKGVLTHA